MEAALEEGFISENRERSGSGAFKLDGEGLRIEVGTDDALRWRGLFQLGDDGGAFGAGFAEGAGEPAGRVLGGQFFEFAQGDALAAARYFRAGLRENGVETLAKGMQGEWSSGSSIATRGCAHEARRAGTTLTFVIRDC
jgi:hypothetical protein